MLTSFPTGSAGGSPAPPLPGSRRSSARRLTGELAPRSGLGPRWVPGTIRSRARSGVGRLRGLGFVAEAPFLCRPRTRVDLRSERPHPSALGPSLPLRAPVTLSRSRRLCQSPSAVRSAPAMALGPPVAQDQLRFQVGCLATQLHLRSPSQAERALPAVHDPGLPNVALLRTRATAARAGEGQGPDPLRVGSEGAAQERHGDAAAEIGHRGAGGRGASAAQGRPGRRGTAPSGPWSGAAWALAAFESGFPQRGVPSFVKARTVSFHRGRFSAACKCFPLS